MWSLIFYLLVLRTVHSAVFANIGDKKNYALLSRDGILCYRLNIQSSYISDSFNLLSLNIVFIYILHDNDAKFL